MLAVKEDHPSCDDPFTIVVDRMLPRCEVVLVIGVETPSGLLNCNSAAISPIDIYPVKIIVADPPGNIAPKR